MHSVDLYAELGLALKGARNPAARAMIDGLGIRCPLIGAGEVSLEKTTWCPALDGGETCLIYPVLSGSHICDPAYPQCHTTGNLMPRDIGDDVPSVIDLVAWRPDKNGAYLRFGNADALGDWLLEPQLEEDALTLYSEPSAWLRAECNGVVVLNWRRIADKLLAWRRIVCDTIELGERCQSELEAAKKRMMPKMPHIEVRRSPHGNHETVS